MSAGLGAARPVTLMLSGVLFLILGLHGRQHLRAGTPDHLLWVCYVANAVMGVGLLLHHRLALGAGFLWVCIGLVLWLGNAVGQFRYLTASEPDVVTSSAMHVGGSACGLLGVIRLGLDAHAWIPAVALLLACQLAARLFTDSALNVNAVFQIRPAGLRLFPSMWSYWLACTVISVFALLLLNRGLGCLFAG